MNNKVFFDTIRPLFGSLSGTQVSGCEAILAEFTKRGLTDNRWLAYMLATAYHETAKTMQPIREFGRGQGKKYGTKFYGRGLVQLTWEANYALMGKLLKVDLVNNPDLALDPVTAIDIMFEGMTKGESRVGDFTHHSLEEYFNDKVTNPVGARRIINGTDKDTLIAGYFAKFLAALNAAVEPLPQPLPQPVPPVETTPEPASVPKVPPTVPVPTKPAPNLLATFFNAIFSILGRR